MSEAATYLALQVDKETIFCWCVLQVTIPLPRVKQYPEMEHCVSGQFANSLSVKSSSYTGCSPPRMRWMVWFPFKVSCYSFSGFPMNGTITVKMTAKLLYSVSDVGACAYGEVHERAHM